jgi:hypothetical protein
MRSEQEALYQARKIVSNVADFLIDFVACDQVLEFSGVAELIGRLDLAVEVIRMANGAPS